MIPAFYEWWQVFRPMLWMALGAVLALGALWYVLSSMKFRL